MEKFYLLLGWISIVGAELLRAVFAVSLAVVWPTYVISIIFILVSLSVSLIKYSDRVKSEKLKADGAKDFANFMEDVLFKLQTSKQQIH